MNYLQFLIDSIKMTFRVWQDDDGATGGDGGEATDAQVDDKEPLAPIEEYVGSLEVNPMQRPLREFNRQGRTHKDVDDLITNSGGELLLTDEEIKAKKAEGKDEKKEKADETKKSGEEPDKKTDDKTKSGDKEKGDKKEPEDDKLTDEEKAERDKQVDEDIKAFFEKTDISQEEFDELPEKVQEILVNKVFAPEDTKGKEETEKLTKDHQELKDQMKAMTSDHTIAARIKEMATKEKVLADPKDILSQNVLDKVDELLADKKGPEAKKLLFDEVAKAVNYERSVQDQVLKDQKDRQSVWKILRQVGDIDKRLAINEKSYKKFDELGEKHDEWKEFTKKDGMQDVIKFLVDKEFTFAQIKKMEPKEVYALYAQSRGWDKEIKKRIYKSGADSVLEKLRNPKKAGTLKNQGKKPIMSRSETDQTGIDADTLIRGLADGKKETKENFQNLLDAYDGDKKMIDKLVAIQGKAYKLAESERKVAT